MLVELPGTGDITDPGKRRKSPGCVFAGTSILIWTTPHNNDGALPAYETGASLPAKPPAVGDSIATPMPVLRLPGPGTFNSPVVHGGAVDPKPVPKRDTTEPALAGIEELLMVPSWFRAAAWADEPGWRRKIQIGRAHV